MMVLSDLPWVRPSSAHSEYQQDDYSMRGESKVNCMSVNTRFHDVGHYIFMYQLNCVICTNIRCF